MDRFQVRFQTIALIAALATAAPVHAGLLTDDGTIVFVVVNHEEQYSILPVGRSVPKGWRPVGKSCSEEDCMKYISEVWTDMRPLAIQQFVEKQFKKHLNDK